MAGCKRRQHDVGEKAFADVLAGYDAGGFMSADVLYNLTLNGTLLIDCSDAGANVKVTNADIPVAWTNAAASSTLTLSCPAYSHAVNFPGTFDIDNRGGWFAAVTANVITGSFSGDDTCALNASTSITSLAIGGNVFEEGCR